MQQSPLYPRNSHTRHIALRHGRVHAGWNIRQCGSDPWTRQELQRSLDEGWMPNFLGGLNERDTLRVMYYLNTYNRNPVMKFLWLLKEFFHGRRYA